MHKTEVNFINKQIRFYNKYERKNMKASDFIVEVLVNNNICKVFGFIGGNNAHLLDSLDKHKDIEIVNTIHEQGAGFAAEGYARVTGKIGVATATSGPGATNLITPIASCFYDSVPTIFITGQVNTYECKNASECENNAPVRQIGFQETDIVSVVKPITKYAILIDNIHDLRYELEKAIFLSEEGRKGPVLIDIPIDLQYKDFNPDDEKSFYDSKIYKEFQIKVNTNDYDIKTISNLLNSSTRPVILVGGGARISDVESELNSLLDKTNIPIVYSLMGKDLIKESYQYNLGFIGAYGNRCASLTLANSDLLIILGSRLDARQTGRQTTTFAREAKIVQVDIDRHELDRKIKADFSINSDVKSFLEKLSTQVISLNIETWQKKVLSYKENYSSLYTINNEEKMPNKIISFISQYSKPGDIVCVDVGLHQMWVAQSLDVKDGQRVLFSGGLGAMGCALPTAIGATLGTGQRSIVIVGDGGFQMNIQELEIAKRRNLPIKIFIMNNAFLGMVRQMQTEFLNKNYIGTQNDYSVPHFKNIGDAYGIKSHEASNIDEIEEIIKVSLQNDDCELIDIQLSESKHLVEPRLVENRGMEDMKPFLDREEFQKQMLIKPLNEKDLKI